MGLKHEWSHLVQRFANQLGHYPLHESLAQ